MSLKFMAALAGILAWSVLTPASSQTYPTRTVNIVVPYPAGGSVDGVARIITQRLNEALGQHFIVDNRAGGAGGVVGANYVSKAVADGSTLLLTASIHVVTPFLNKNIPYDVVKDFTPITLIATSPLLVSTNPTVPASTLPEFFDLVRKNPGQYTFATSGFGSAGHLAIELLKRNAGLDTLVIAYKGAAPALNDLMGNQVQLMVDPMLSSLPLAQGKLIKPLAITSATRSAAALDIPTVAESGMPGFQFVSWYGLWGPKNLPPAIVATLQTEVAKILALPDVKRQLAALGFDAVGSSQEAFRSFIGAEMATDSKIIADAGIKAQ